MLKRKITDDQIFAARDKYEKLAPTIGNTQAIATVANELGVSTRTVHRYFSKIQSNHLKEVRWEKGVYRKDKARIERAYNYYRQGHTLVEVSEVFDIPRTTLHRAFVKLCNGNFVPNDYTKETIKSFRHSTTAKINSTKMSKRQRQEVEQWLASLSNDDINSIPIVNTTTENNYSKFTTGNGYDVADSYDLDYQY